MTASIVVGWDGSAEAAAALDWALAHARRTRRPVRDRRRRSSPSRTT